MVRSRSAVTINGSNRARPILPHRLGEDSNDFTAKGEIQGALSYTVAPADGREE